MVKFAFTILLWFNSVWAVEYDFGTAIKKTFSQSLTLQNAKKQLDVVSLERKNAFSLFFPRLDFASTFSRIDQGPSKRENPWKSNLGFNLSEVLYNNHQNLIDYDIALEKEKKAQLNLVMIENEQLLQLSSTYLEFSLNTELLEIQRKLNEILKNQYRIVESGHRQ